MRYTGPVHFRYAPGTKPPHVEARARVYLGVLQTLMRRGVTTQYLVREEPDCVVTVAFIRGMPVVDILPKFNVSAQTEVGIVELYVESGVLDVLSFLEAAPASNYPANLLRAPVATTRSPTGTVRFEMPGEVFSYTPKLNGESKLTPTGWQDKIRRSTSASVFSGKLRLWVQALYGSKRQDFDGSSGVGVSIREVNVSPTVFGGAVLVTDSEYRYWLLTIGTTITARRLLIGVVGQLVRNRLRAGLMDAVSAETYILADAVPSSEVITIGSVPIVGDTLSYGWHATSDGTFIRAVTILSHGFGAGFTAYTYTLDVSFDSEGLPHVSASQTMQDGGIDVLDSLVISTGGFIFRRTDMIGTPKDCTVYGFFDPSDNWVPVNYVAGSTHGFLANGVDATVGYTPPMPITSTSHSAPAWSEHIVLPGGSYFPVPKPVPGFSGYPPLPNGYSADGYYWDFDEYRTDYMRYLPSGTAEFYGVSACVIPNNNCSGVYLIKHGQQSVAALSGNVGNVDRYARRTLWPRVFRSDTSPIEYLSDGDPVDPIEDGYKTTYEYGGFGQWYTPSFETGHRNGHGYFITNGTFSIDETVVTFTSMFTTEELADVKNVTFTSGTVTEGFMPFAGLETHVISPTPEILYYILGYDFYPGSAISIGNWGLVLGLDLVNYAMEGVILSFESVNGVSVFAREPNAVAYEHAPHDFPPYFAMVGRI